MPLAPIEEAIADIRQGRMIILVDDEDRENEGDLTMAAEVVTPEAIFPFSSSSTSATITFARLRISISRGDLS